MKSSARLDVSEIATAVVSELEQRRIAEAAHHAAESARQEREFARANAESARLRRADLESRLAVVTEEQERCHAACIRIEAELKSLPGALLAERRRQSVLLGELARLQRELGAH